MRLIDAEALTEQIQKLSNNEYMVNWLGVLIDTQPTVKVEPIEVPKPVRHGKWIEEIGMFMCSECGDAWSSSDAKMIFGFNYCPNCGAKMESEHETD